MRYRAWADKARSCAARVGGVPPAELTETVEIIAYYQPPASWSQKKQLAALGTRKRTVPDGDNVMKLVDVFWKQDAALGRQVVDRFWGEIDETQITIRLIDTAVETPEPSSSQPTDSGPLQVATP